MISSLTYIRPSISSPNAPRIKIPCIDEQAHLDGAYPYEGVNRVCGWLESVGRFLIRYKRADIDIYIEEEQSLPLWGGLRVVHLPGHTKGHCGYYSAKHDLLFAGDLFASMFYGDFPPPPVLNSVPHLIPESFRKVMALNSGGILPCHYTQAKYDPVTLRRIFDEIYWRRFREWTLAWKTFEISRLKVWVVQPLKVLQSLRQDGRIDEFDTRSIGFGRDLRFSVFVQRR